MKIYQIVERGKGICENYTMGFADDKECGEYLKAKEEARGYVPGCGGDKTYSAVAWWIGNEGQYFIDLDRVWNAWAVK